MEEHADEDLGFHHSLDEQRLGRTAEERLRWVVTFSQLDLRRLRPEERVALGHDLRAFALMQLPPSGALKGLGGYGSSYTTAEPVMSDAVLIQMQAEIAEGLRGLLSGTPWYAPGPQQTMLARQSPPTARQTQLQVRWDYPDERSAILGGLFNVLLQAGDVLRPCRECGKPLVARKRQVYCSSACSNKFRDRKRPPRVRRPTHAKSLG
jgi:hypothetical protein